MDRHFYDRSFVSQQKIRSAVIENNKLSTVTTSGLLIVLVVAVVSWFVQYHWKRRRLYSLANKLPGPPSFPLIGNALYFAGSTKDILDSIMRLITSYPSPLRVWLGPKLFIGISKPEDLEVILNSPKSLKKDQLYDYAIPWVGTGLFTAPVNKWRRHRKIIMPTFNQKILDTFVEVFAERSDVLIDNLRRELGQGYFDVFKYLSPCTLDIICETIMGVKVNAQKVELPYTKAVERQLEILFKHMFQIWYHSDTIFKLSGLEAEQKQCVNICQKFTDAVVKRKKQIRWEREEENKSKPQSEMYEDDEYWISKRKNFLDLLLELSEAGANFTDEELREEVDTMMIAGNDTTATVNSFMFMALGMHQDIQDKVYEELMDVFGNSDRPVTAEDLPKLKYLERVVKETMRLFPVGPAIVRAVTQELPLGKHTLPAGCSCVLVIMHTHRDPDIWKNPLKFDPDRFLPEEVAKRHPYSYIPFSGGPRNCIGLKYGMMSIKSLQATVLRKYRFQCDYKIEDVKLKADLILKPNDGFKVKIQPR